MIKKILIVSALLFVVNHNTSYAQEVNSKKKEFLILDSDKKDRHSANSSAMLKQNPSNKVAITPQLNVQSDIKIESKEAAILLKIEYLRQQNCCEEEIEALQTLLSNK